jgi:hypothetical protein
MASEMEQFFKCQNSDGFEGKTSFEASKFVFVREISEHDGG